MCKKLIKNAQPFGKNFQKTLGGGFFLTHTVGYMGRRFLQVKRPNQQYQSTEGTNSTQTNQKPETKTNKASAPLIQYRFQVKIHEGKSCIHMATMGVKGLSSRQLSGTFSLALWRRVN